MQLFDEVLESLDPQLTELPFDWDDVFVTEMEAAARRDETARPLKDRSALQTVPLAAAAPLEVTPEMPVETRRMAARYNRLGGLYDAVAAALSLTPAVVLALDFVESGGRASPPGRTPIWFDNRRFWALWGARHRDAYARHFAHGATGDDDRFRARADAPLRPLHGDGYLERDALATATRLAGEDTALRALRVGPARLPLADHLRLGYATPAAMRQALDDERYQVLALFELVCARGLVACLQQRRFDDFANTWRPSAAAGGYASRLSAAVADAERLLSAAAAPPPREPRQPLPRWIETGWWLPHRRRRPPWSGLKPHPHAPKPHHHGAKPHHHGARPPHVPPRPPHRPPPHRPSRPRWREL